MGVPKNVRDYLADIGAKGGASGKGEAKRRTKAHYRRAGLLGAESRQRMKNRSKRKLRPRKRLPNVSATQTVV